MIIAEQDVSRRSQGYSLNSGDAHLFADYGLLRLSVPKTGIVWPIGEAESVLTLLIMHGKLVDTVKALSSP